MLPSLVWLATAWPKPAAPAASTQPSARRHTRPLPQPNLAQLAQPTAVLPDVRGPRSRRPQVPGPARPAGLGPLPRAPHQSSLARPSPGPPRPYVAAYLVKLNEGLRSMGHLRRYLVEHPALVWLLGFPLVPDPTAPHGFDVERSLPSRRQLGRVLRELDNAAAQFLLDSTVQLIRQALPPDLDCSHFGDVIALDTKHIMAWVKENNPKPTSQTATTKPASPKAIPTANSAARNAATKVKATAPPRRPPPATRPPRPARRPSASITGATPPASSPPKCRTGVNSCWPN